MNIYSSERFPPTVVTAADKQKSFYEDVVQIGDKDNTGIGTVDAEIAVACLTEYMQGFQQRNPNFYVFNAVLHLDEATPHLHIDYIPIGHYNQGVDTRNGIAQALKEMGYGTGMDAIARWRTAECKVLTEICNRHGIQIAAPEQSRGSLTVEQYREYARVKEQTEEEKQVYSQIKEKSEYERNLLHHREELRSQVEGIIDGLDEQYQEKFATIEHLDEQIAQKSIALTETTAALADNQSLLEISAQKVAQIRAIDEIETGKAGFGGKVKLSKADYTALTDLAKKQLAAESKETALQTHIIKLESENKSLTEEVAELKKEKAAGNFFDLRIELAKVRSERDNLQRKIDRVLEFIKIKGLLEQLKAFLNPKVRGRHN